MFKKLEELIIKELELVTLKLDKYNEELNNPMNEIYRELGEKYSDIVNHYAITDEELLAICESVAQYVTCTRITNLDWLLFVNGDKEKPRLPSMVKNYTGGIIRQDTVEIIDGFIKQTDGIRITKEQNDRIVELISNSQSENVEISTLKL